MKKIEKIGKKTFNRDLLFEIVVELCAIRPRSIAEIASLINRTDNYVRHNLVTPLREAGKLAYTIPEKKK